MNESIAAHASITTQIRRQLQVREVQIIHLEKMNEQWNALVEVRKEIRSMTDWSLEQVMCFYSAKWDQCTGLARLERLTSDEHINTFVISHE
jgi:hypothetical protein